MIRVATTLAALLSILSTAIASAICTHCCQRQLEHQLTACQDKAHAHLGPDVHPMNHVHMVAQDSDASVVVQECDHQFQNRHLGCQTSACLTAKPVQASVASVPANQPPITPQFLTVTLCGSVPTARAHPPCDVYGIAITRSLFVSAPLRI
jgi:hypothetical protein